jgi:2',3'-cyclic-nucleotide 2'-phosphodiesterase (5'-nucleotidase family)
MTNRRDFLVKFTMAASAASILKPLNVFAGVSTNPSVLSGTNRLTILHTANLNGQLYALEMGEKMVGYGGLQNITKEIAGIKKDTAAVLLIDAGNITGLLQTKEERLNFYKKVNNAGYDVVIPGRTDLALGKTCFDELIKEGNLNAVSSTGQLAFDGLLPYSIFNKGKTRVGVINAGTAALNDDHHASASQAAIAINQTAHVLRSSKNCTLIICVVQFSVIKCSKLTGLSNGIDVMVSSAEKTSLHNTQIIRNKSNHEVIVSYAGAKGGMMSRIDLTFNDKGEKIYMASKAIIAGAEDQSYAGIVKKCAMYNA